jgi:hypothetical protein
MGHALSMVTIAFTMTRLCGAKRALTRAKQGFDKARMR